METMDINENPFSDHIGKLFVGGLNYDTTEEGVREYFEKFGELLSCELVKEPSTGRSRGFAFLTFAEMAGVDAVQAERPHHLDGRKLETRRAMPKRDPDSRLLTNKLFIGGLNAEVEEQDLKDYFCNFGTITDIYIVLDFHTKKRKGIAFVTFDNHDPVDKAVLMRHHNIKGFMHDVKKAQPKVDTRKTASYYDMPYANRPTPIKEEFSRPYYVLKDNDSKMTRTKQDSSDSTKILRSSRAGLKLPVGLVRRRLKEGENAMKFSNEAPVFMAAVLENLIAGLLHLGQDVCRQDNRRKVTPRHLLHAIRSQSDWNVLLADMYVSQGDVHLRP
ncbi:HNRNPA2B1 [Cordylochernes scorpioides]|uniref:HNRNPA2B1 n=1 Tax=Cordylochernes scorpioides TaxID=51811 RepID=A0ABY6K116_9ARAC|nr:HNRNPA2B1 [Cordylochernes scorpioides]